MVYAGKLADPEFRKERARKARAAQESVDFYIKKLVDAAPPLSEQQRARLAALLANGGGQSAAA